MSSVIVVNGRRIVIEGDSNSVTVSNGRVVVDGREVAQTSKDGGPTTIQWEGPLASLTVHGDVRCGDVQGDVRANVVNCEAVGGSVHGNAVNCGNVSGSVSGAVVNRR
jgi:hypothetical protein